MNTQPNPLDDMLEARARVDALWLERSTTRALLTLAEKPGGNPDARRILAEQVADLDAAIGAADAARAIAVDRYSKWLRA